jgi:hypothetical protein
MEQIPALIFVSELMQVLMRNSHMATDTSTIVKIVTYLFSRKILDLVANNIELFILIKLPFAVELKDMGQKVIEEHAARELDRVREQWLVLSEIDQNDLSLSQELL